MARPPSSGPRPGTPSRSRRNTMITLGAAILLLGGLFLGLAFIPQARMLIYFVFLLVYFGLFLLIVLSVVCLAALLLQLVSGRTWSATRSLLKFTGWYAATLVALVIVVRVWAASVGSSSYLQVGGPDPLVLTAQQMAGASKVTLGLRTGGSGAPSVARIVTAPAAGIIDAIEAARTGGQYRLRLIAATPGVTWTLTPGEGVTLEGEMTVAPGTWRDFHVMRASAEAVSVTSAGTGRCPLEGDPARCGM